MFQASIIQSREALAMYTKHKRNVIYRFNACILWNAIMFAIFLLRINLDFMINKGMINKGMVKNSLVY